ncbi:MULTISPECIES: hypothetical protein [unclassified Psychrobacillus]|uniref:hypothetical protein n=1 Tax=unclassified Psychrobacillus TaxID=2636677 RepID=UPI0030F9B91F
MEQKQVTVGCRHLDAVIAIRDHGWRFEGSPQRPLLVPPLEDERRQWTAMWDEHGYPHWLPRCSEGKV